MSTLNFMSFVLFRNKETSLSSVVNTPESSVFEPVRHNSVGVEQPFHWGCL